MIRKVLISTQHNLRGHWPEFMLFTLFVFGFCSCCRNRHRRAHADARCSPISLHSATRSGRRTINSRYSIPKRPRSVEDPSSGALELVLFGGGTATARDLPLAYGIAASRTQDTALRLRATALLQDAERASPDDVEVLFYLAELYRNGNREADAVPLYRRAIRLDPTQVTASVGLGGILMERGELAQAIWLWQDAFVEEWRIGSEANQSGDDAMAQRGLRAAESSLMV